MRIGMLAARAGITASRVRFYEARGLLPDPPRRDSGYRDYDEGALEVLRLIGFAQGLGYTLREIASYLRTPDDAGRRDFLGRCVKGKLGELDALLADTQARRASLQKLGDVLRGAQ